MRTPATSPLEEYEEGKQIWMKVDNIKEELYNQHYKPTIFKRDCCLLTTDQYIPPWIDAPTAGMCFYIVNCHLLPFLRN